MEVFYPNMPWSGVYSQEQNTPQGHQDIKHFPK